MQTGDIPDMHLAVPGSSRYRARSKKQPRNATMPAVVQSAHPSLYISAIPSSIDRIAVLWLHSSSRTSFRNYDIGYAAFLARLQFWMLLDDYPGMWLPGCGSQLQR